MQVFTKRSFVVLGVLLLSGCTQLPIKSHSTATPVPVNLPHTPLPASVSTQLSERPGYAIIQTNDTQWGANVEFDLSPVYYAASGRLCREGTITQTNTALNEEIIACQYGAYWGYNRNVTKSLGRQQGQ